MYAFVGRRLAQAILVVWGAVTIVFIIVRIVPGDPALLMLPPATATTEQVDALRQELGLSAPLLVQYLHFMAGAIRLDFGNSYRLSGSAISVVLSHMGASLELALIGMIIALVLGISLGIVAARRPNGYLDKLISGFSFVTQGLPQFWLGIMLILVFARALKILPSAGNEGLPSAILPALSIALPFVGWIAKMVRSSLLEELREEYIRTARSKGLNDAVIFRTHVARNAMIPLVTLIGLLLGEFITSSVIVEVVFTWPGIGRVLIDSITFRDYSVVQACMIVIAATYAILNLLVDVLYVYMNPRLKFKAAA